MSDRAERPSVAIVSLAIRDFRGIDRLKLDFLGPDGAPNSLVALAGPNGCGKTAVLEAALVLAGGAKLITGPRGRRAIRSGATEYEMSATFQFDSKIVSSRDTSGFPNPVLEQAVPLWYFSASRVPTRIGPVEPTVGRRGRRPAKTDQNRLRNVKQSLVNAATLERFEDRDKFPRFRRYSAAIEEINRAWRDFYPGTDQSFAVEIGSSDREDGGGFDVFLRTPEAPRLQVDLLSSGQLEVFLLLSTLALNEDREGIIFIDEPELHLDPQWHRLFVRSLMRLQPRAQLVVATHSPEIFDAAKSYERHFLVPENDPRAHLWREVAAGV
jgi:energy-coupling factor transporter ATP-binding protein EcfA2